jgi:hypothetical protein
MRLHPLQHVPFEDLARAANQRVNGTVIESSGEKVER